jgi:CheY-like chemotaxis protein/two-component sensor histidine kinase
MQDDAHTHTISEDGKALAIMAHDIKAPLSTIVSLLGVIDKGYVDDLAKIRELVSRASQKAQILIAMVDDILDYTLLSDKSMMKTEIVDLCEILDESISMMKAFADERGISIIAPVKGLALGKEKKMVNGNYTFLMRVFNNIIGNAIKYNKEKGKITIECSEETGKNAISTIIADTGIGIPEEEMDKVFKIFERGKYARRNINGSLGLGLSLVKQIVEDHNGKIDLYSTVGVGTTITVTLPFYKEENKDREIKKEEQMSQKILVVDDDIDVLESRKIVLEHNKYDVVSATNVKVAQELLENEAIDLIILDVMMEKDSDGFNFAQALKKDPKYKHIPIILATAVNQRTKFKFDIEKDGDFLPVEKFMEKPIDPDDLIVTIRGLLK